MKFKFSCSWSLQNWVIKIKCCCCSGKIKVNPVWAQQQWWGNDWMLLKAHSDMRKQEQIILIVVKKLDELAHLGCLSLWQLVRFFVLFPHARNDLSTTLNQCLIIVAMAKQSWFLSSNPGNNIFSLSLISTKITSKKILILFN